MIEVFQFCRALSDEKGKNAISEDMISEGIVFRFEMLI